MYGAQTSMDGLYRLLSLFIAETFFFSFSFPCFSLSLSNLRQYIPGFMIHLHLMQKMKRKEKEKTTDKETTSTTKFICQIGANGFPLNNLSEFST